MRLFICGFLLIVSGVAATPRQARAQPGAPIAPPSPEPTTPIVQEGLLRAGRTVTLRVRQVIPRDGLSPGDRVLNGMPTLVAGDRVLAEILAPGPHVPALVGGTVFRVTPPGHFGRPGRATLELGQLVTTATDKTAMAPWIFDLEDRRFNVQIRRKILLALFAVEGLGAGASVASQLGGGSNPYFIGGGAGVGLLSGIGYASFMPGREATIEPGDTFRVEVGSLSYRPLSSSPSLPLYPAQEAVWKKGRPRP